MEKRDLHLTDALFEFQTMEYLFKEAQREEFTLNDATVPLLMLLARATWKKLHYYVGKYNLKIPSADVYFVHELANHLDFDRASGPDYIDDGKTVDVPAKAMNKDMLNLTREMLEEAPEQVRHKLMESITNSWADYHKDNGGE